MVLFLFQMCNLRKAPLDGTKAPSTPASILHCGQPNDLGKPNKQDLKALQPPNCCTPATDIQRHAGLRGSV